MDIKDIQVGKTYRYLINAEEKGTVAVKSVDEGVFPIVGATTVDDHPEWDRAEGMFAADELIEEV